MEKSYDKGVFAANLNRYITEKDINSTDICDFLGISKSVVSDWRNGRKIPRMDKIEALAYYFGIEKSDLIEKEKPVTANDELSEVERIILAGYHNAPENVRQAVCTLLGVPKDEE